MSTQLVDDLRELGAHVEGLLPDVNSGGCCVYAAYVARRLHRLGVPAWGVVSNRDIDPGNADLNAIRRKRKPRNVRDWNNSGVIFSHVLVQFVEGGQIWTHDTGTTTDRVLERDPTLNRPMMAGYLTVSELSALSSNQDGWNDMFDRDEGIPVIRAAVREYLRSDS